MEQGEQHHAMENVRAAFPDAASSSGAGLLADPWQLVDLAHGQVSGIRIDIGHHDFDLSDKAKTRFRFIG
jgi:hypothetical protein